MRIIQLTKDDTTTLRQIAKSFGIKGCKMVNLYCLVGNQNEVLQPKVAHTFMDALNSLGYFISHEATCRELADKGMVSNLLIAKVARP